jgi:hypothetical protein
MHCGGLNARLGAVFGECSVSAGATTGVIKPGDDAAGQCEDYTDVSSRTVGDVTVGELGATTLN